MVCSPSIVNAAWSASFASISKAVIPRYVAAVSFTDSKNPLDQYCVVLPISNEPLVFGIKLEFISALNTILYVAAYPRVILQSAEMAPLA